jgi:hypothetical protein
MSHYCGTDDVSLRLGLDSAQRLRANNRLESAIRRASIYIDSIYRDYGRDTPSEATAESTLDGAISAGATSITLTDASDFSTSGNGNIDGDSFAWTGKSSNDLTGCTGISFDHHNNSKVQEGELAHIMREVCADYAAGIYLQDDAALASQDPLRSPMLIERANDLLFRYAKLGSVD